ncbi:lipoprotein [Pectobacterium versatile]|nr:lipoprotein [Pectobacterium versatile]
MLRAFIMALGLCVSLIACSTPAVSVRWDYGTGSNLDEIWTTNVEFYRGGTFIGGYPGGGGGPSTSAKWIREKQYYWAGGGGLPVEGMAVPDRAVIEMVSFYDRKRYRITVNLPADLAQQMQQRYQVNRHIDQRSWLYFGLAPGGYYEVLLKGDKLLVKPDLLLARGIAEEVTDNWYDKKFPIGVSQYTVTLQNFDKEYGELFKQYPIPLGMDWAPIMDAYRANQPKTDQQPVK